MEKLSYTKYSLKEGLIKLAKKGIIFVGGFGLFVFFANPELFKLLLESLIPLGAATTLIALISLLINYIKVAYPGKLPRWFEENSE